MLAQSMVPRGELHWNRLEAETETETAAELNAVLGHLSRCALVPVARMYTDQ